MDDELLDPGLQGQLYEDVSFLPQRTNAGLGVVRGTRGLLNYHDQRVHVHRAEGPSVVPGDLQLRNATQEERIWL